MSCRLSPLIVAGLLACLAFLAPVAVCAAEKKPVAPAVKQTPVAPVNVNVTVNVHVSRDTKVDVKIEAPFVPVVGSLQLPDFLQGFVNGLLKPAPKDAPARPGQCPPRAK